MCGLAVEDGGEMRERSLVVLQKLAAAVSRGKGQDGEINVQIDCTDQDRRTALFWAASSGFFCSIH